jgi:hypothetical protein
MSKTLDRLCRELWAAEYTPPQWRAASGWARDPVHWLALELKQAGMDTRERLWRVTYSADAPIHTVSIDLPVSDEEGTEHIFDSWDDLPEWMQDRIRALGMITGKPPTGWIDGIGRRMSDTVYWVVE